MQPHAPRLSIRRGLRAALIAATIFALAPVILALVFVAGRCLISDYTASERWYELQGTLLAMAAPVVGCALVCGCAAWATSAPAGSHRFAPSLAIVFLVSVFSRFVLGSMQLTPRRFKSTGHPMIYSSEAAIMVGPPVASAAILAAIRVFRSSLPQRTPAAAKSANPGL